MASTATNPQQLEFSLATNKPSSLLVGGGSRGARDADPERQCHMGRGGTTEREGKKVEEPITVG